MTQQTEGAVENLCKDIVEIYLDIPPKVEDRWLASCSFYLVRKGYWNEDFEEIIPTPKDLLTLLTRLGHFMDSQSFSSLKDAYNECIKFVKSG